MLTSVTLYYVILSDDIDKFNAAMREQYLPELKQYIPIDVDQKDFDNALQSEWFMPDEYKNYDIKFGY